MKLLQGVQTNLLIVGICSNPTQASSTKIKLIIPLFVFGLTTSAIYLCHDANTFLEYSSSMYITTALAMTIFVYVIFIVNMSKLFDLISECQELLDQSKSIRFKANWICDYNWIANWYFISESQLTLRSMVLCERTNQQAEKWNKIGSFVMTKVTPVRFITSIHESMFLISNFQ